jgi:hypothetical protein
MSPRPARKAPTPKPPAAARALELADEALAHKKLKDKSPEGIASRVAQRLNREGYTLANARGHFTGPQVLAAFLRGQLAETNLRTFAAAQQATLAPRQRSAG